MLTQLQNQQTASESIEIKPKKKRKSTSITWAEKLNQMHKHTDKRI